MRIAGATLLLAVLGAATAREVKNRPVSKVVTLLKDMVIQLQKEADEDQEVYETMGCWCETNDREKTKAISDAEERITSLQAAIEEFTGESSRLNTEIQNLNTEVSKNQQALDAATALREKQLAEFNVEEKDMLQSISSLKSAVTVLNKHNSALLQMPDEEADSLIVTVHDALRKHTEAISPQQRRTLQAFVQRPDGYFDPEASMAQARVRLSVRAKAKYAPQSGEIFGIMSQMKESFETNLAASQKEEMENVAAYNDLKTAKETEIAAGQQQADTKTAELADADEKRAESKQDLEDTQEKLASDSRFLADLKEKCANTDAEYEERVRSRNLEIQAVSKALEFLSSDDAQDLFTSTLSGPSFVQKRSREEVAHQAAVGRFLQEAARARHSPRLSAVAAKVRMDKFGAVKETIQGMIDALVKEKEDDVQKKDFCVDALNSNERETSSKDREKQNAIAKIDDLAATIDTLTKSIEELKAEVKELLVQMKRAGENREKANKEFQGTVADQRATQKLLTAALDVLKGFYNKAVFTQVKAKARLAGGQAPPPAFKAYEKSSTSGGVMGMIGQIIDDAKAMEAEAIQSEEDAQLTYQSFVEETNRAVDEATKEIAHKSGQKAKAEEDKTETEVTRDEILDNLEQLNAANLDTHRNCDFLLKNFQVRAEARGDEIQALKEAIAMFSGASFATLMQNWQG